MAYTEQEARELVVMAGKKLVETGLIARTWGNISARISDKQFAITPSGLAYETLLPEQIVIVNIADCTYSGDIKPSSEKGVHADVYRLRPTVNFCIHTHQDKASVVGVLGKNLSGYNAESRRILGENVLCADYGISSTEKLRKNVAAAIAKNPTGKAVLMKHHGAVCMGRDYEDAFNIADALEKVCAEIAQAGEDTKAYLQAAGSDAKLSAKEHTDNLSINLGKSERSGNGFLLELDGSKKSYVIGEVSQQDELAARVHAEIYKHNDVNYIIHETDKSVVAVSSTGEKLKPRIDDIAQIAGVNIKCATGIGAAIMSASRGENANAAKVIAQKVNQTDITEIVKKLKKRNAVLLQGAGALCTGKTYDDAEAVCILLKKDCEAEMLSVIKGCSNHLGWLDAFIQRLVYTKKYSKKKVQ